MRVATWNINSIRSRRERVGHWLTTHQPDVVLLQETKCTDEVFAQVVDEMLEQHDQSGKGGYEYAHHGFDHWNGVGILGRVGLDDVAFGFAGVNREPYDEARLISATCGGVRVHSVYVPNGRELDDPHYLFKLVWLERLRTVVDPAVPTILAGDFNVAPADIDIYHPKRFRRTTHASPPERAAIESLLDIGLIDVTRDHLTGGDEYTFWNYRPGQFERNRGLRIDLALCTPDVAAWTDRVWIDTEARRPACSSGSTEKPSDHAPVVIDLNLQPD